MQHLMTQNWWWLWRDDITSRRAALRHRNR